MKKIIAMSLIAYLVGSMSFGQSEKPYFKGTFLTGGSFAINFEKDKEFLKGSPPNADVTYINKLRSIETSFQIGYFILNNLSIGIKSIIAFTNNITSDEGSSIIIWDIKDRDLITGPFFRYYLKPGLFFEGFGGFGFQNQETNDKRYKQIINAVSAGVGYSFFLNKFVALEPILSYDLLQKKASDYDKKNTINKFSLSVGLQFYPGKRNR